MILPDTILLLSNTPASLAAFAKFSDLLQNPAAQAFLALPADLDPYDLPPLCRELPAGIQPLMRLPAANPRPARLAAAIGRPFAGVYFDDWTNFTGSAVHQPADFGAILGNMPALVDAPVFRINNAIAVTSDYFETTDCLTIDLASPANDLAVVEQVAKFSAQIAAGRRPAAIPLPCGGWLTSPALHALVTELAANLRTPQSSPLSLAEAFAVVIGALAVPKRAEWLWSPLAGPTAHPRTAELITTAAAVRKAAGALATAGLPRVPNTIPVDGYPIAAAAFLQVAATILRDQSPDDGIIRIPAVPRSDFAAALKVLRDRPAEQRSTLQGHVLALAWETAFLNG